ncbi:MAG: hypothetical protein RL337_1030 [Bacteroidota bacterium]|jgi:hypothetical protein
MFNFVSSMMKHTPIYPITIIFLALLASSCSNSYQKLAANYQINKASTSPNYSDVAYWAAHPAIHDPSDSVPAPLLASYKKDTAVDVFFIHPTTYLGTEKPFGLNADISDALLAAKTDYSPLLYQASLFNVAGRLFAPRYRQTHISAYYPATGADTTLAIAAFELAYQDVKSAFEYYLANENKGRAIIIASHSQGTTHGIRLVKEFFDGKPLQKQLVAAYLVGIPVNPMIFSSIKACDTPKQTGCICSWRTYKEGYTPPFIEKEKFDVIVTNPLTFTKSIPNASWNANKGGVLTNFNKLAKGVAEAKLTDKILWTAKPKIFGSFLVKNPNYHIGDYNLYYVNVRENVIERMNAYKNEAH